MADGKGKVSGADRARVLGSEGYEIDYIAPKQGVSRDQAHELVSRVGNSRKDLDSAAEQLTWSD
jgi:hypothetical protein